MYQQGFQDYSNIVAEPANGAFESDYAELSSMLMDGAHSYGCSKLHFDTREELLWSGSESGHITSYYSGQLQKYTSFRIHPLNNAVRDVISNGTRIYSLSRDRLTCSQRGGLQDWCATHNELKNCQALFSQRENTVLVGCSPGNQIFELDLTRQGKIVRQVKTDEGGVTLFRSTTSDSRYLYTADGQGNVHCRDPTSLAVQHKLECHSGTLTDFDVCSNLLVTSGLSSHVSQSHRHVRSVQNRFVQIYDLRMMKAVAPMQLLFEPRFLRFIPPYTSRLLIVSADGDFILVEPSDMLPPTTPYYKINTMGGQIADVALSTSVQAIGFGTSSGHISVWSSRQSPVFNQYSQETEWPSMEANYPVIPITDETTPLSIIPAPYPQNGEKLLSDWPDELIQRRSYRPRPIDAEILSTMNIIEKIGYAPKPSYMDSQQLPYILPADHPSQINRRMSNTGNGEGIVPVIYRPVEMSFAHFPAAEDRNAEIQKYNKTTFVGLEPHIPNTYCNSMLQLLYFVEPLRAALQSHSSLRETDLAAELGYLFHLLDNKKGGSAPASNFLRSFRVSPQATALRLVLNNGAGSADVARRHGNLGRLIQSWNRFILQQIHTDTEMRDENEDDETRRKRQLSECSGQSTGSVGGEGTLSLAQKFFETRQKVSTRFKSGHVNVSYSSQFLINIDWHPWHAAKTSESWKTKRLDFAEVIKKSIWSEMHTKSWCDEAGSYQNGSQTRQPLNLPEILVLNCHLESTRDEELWRVQSELAESDDSSFIPFNMKFRIYKKGTIDILTEETPPPASGEEYEDYSYDLHGTVIFIQEPGNPIGNLVSHIRVNQRYHKMKKTPLDEDRGAQWYLFNDFWIQKIDAQDAVNFDPVYATPCILYFTRTDLDKRHALEIKCPLEASVLQPGKSVSKINSEAKLFTPLDQTDELPSKGTLVAIDCEFVTLNAEETELRSDGTNAIVRPSHSAVARVSCIRGAGAQEGMPFIDDYISTSEQVVDYLTKFSGIQPGDLDAAISSKYLATLKTTYCKLRYLVEVGVTFIGHGLNKDFNELNLFVRKEQIIDTVNLFHLPRKRLVSLRFLAWYFLKKRIQEDFHDSIEDARTALHLYKKYMEITANGRKTQEFRMTILRALYDEGGKLEWKVPDASFEHELETLTLE